ncbi:RNA-binding domain-containing protein [Backusella circina FSU 941]|nr:RNA-binding domain-containing protein [Backusella circina FSU 941]
MTYSKQIPTVDGNINKGEHAKTAEKSSMGQHNTSTEGHTSVPYPQSVPYGAYIDPRPQHAMKKESDPANYTTFVYPLSPQFSVQYYPDFSNGFQSYPGSPVFHPQSPPMHPSSPPFSPTFQYQGGGIALSPPTHAYMIPSHPNQPFSHAHITSPVLTGVASIPGSPPQHYLPGPYIITDSRKRNYPQQQHHQQQQHHHHHQILQQQQQLEQQLEDEMNSYHTHNVYIRGLPLSTTDDSFLDMCKVYGNIASSKVMIDQKTGECKGYGFVMFENREDCKRAIDGLNKNDLQASFAKIGQESFSSRLRDLQDESSTNIYLSNLPLKTTEEQLEELFQPYRTISSLILRDPQSGMSRGVGFARMDDRLAATAIIERFNGHIIEGSSAPLQVRFADSPAQKKLKNQTGRRRIVRPDFQSMSNFSVRPIMPITPETMLGIIPSSLQMDFTEQSQARQT